MKWAAHRLQHSKILKLPLYSCQTILPITRYSSSCNPCGSSSSDGPRDGKSKSSVTYKNYVPPPYKDHDYKNMSIGRPMSPHLTIIAPTITALTSISQRISGVITATFALMLSGGTLFLADGIETYVAFLQSLQLSRSSAFIIKVIVGVPFAFHYFNGIRFCSWNAGYLLSLDQVYGTAKKAIIAGFVGAFLFALL